MNTRADQHSYKAITRLVVPLVVCAASLAVANPFGGVPNPAVSGAAISASQMNQNFGAIATYMNTLDQRLGALEARPPKASAPVGTVVASLLTPAQFAAEVPDDEVWVVADGSTNHTNTRWFEVTGKAAIPDLRGRFLRGANLGRAVAQGNPDDTALGAEQGDRFGRHSHTVYTGAVRGREDGCQAQAFWGRGENDNFAESAGLCTSGSGDNSPLSMEGGAETRPRNVTVNYYVRVD